MHKVDIKIAIFILIHCTNHAMEFVRTSLDLDQKNAEQLCQIVQSKSEDQHILQNLKSLLTKNVNVNVTYQYLPLIAYARTIPVAQFLIDHGADEAVKTHGTDIIISLLYNDAADPDLIPFYVKHGADCDGRSNKEFHRNCFMVETYCLSMPIIELIPTDDPQGNIACLISPNTKSVFQHLAHIAVDKLSKARDSEKHCAQLKKQAQYLINTGACLWSYERTKNNKTTAHFSFHQHINYSLLCETKKQQAPTIPTHLVLPHKRKRDEIDQTTDSYNRIQDFYAFFKQELHRRRIFIDTAMTQHTPLPPVVLPLIHAYRDNECFDRPFGHTQHDEEKQEIEEMIKHRDNYE